MKKFIIIFNSLILTVIFSFLAIGCNSNDNDIKDEQSSTTESAVRLEAPKNISMSNDLVYWDSVSNALGYTFKINSREINTSDLEFKVSDYISESCTFNLKVKSRGNGINIFDSDWSETLSFDYKAVNRDETTDHDNNGETIDDKTTTLSTVNQLNANKKLNAYIPVTNNELQSTPIQPFNTINIDNKFYYYYFYLGNISDVPLYHSTYIKYTGINFNLGFEFQQLNSETFHENVSQANEIIDTHSYTGGFDINLHQNIKASFGVLKTSFNSTESTDHHWTNDWGSIKTNSVNTERALLAQYGKTVTLNFNISEEAGLKKGFCYRVAYYSPVHAFGVVAYDVEADQYATTSDVLVSDTTGLVIEESETSLFSYDKSSKIEFDVDEAINYAKEHPLEQVDLSHSEKEDIDIPGDNTLFAGGFGTTESPYLISNETQLKNISHYKDKNYAIVADFNIDANSFNSISEFKGSIDGKGHIITFNNKREVNFMRIGDGQYGGLIDDNYGLIKDLVLKNVDYQSKDAYHKDKYKISMGGVVGLNHEDGVLDNIKVINGNFVCDRNNSAFGSICGTNNGTIMKCSADCVIYATGDCGGIVGYTDGGIIKDCTFSGTIGIYIANDDGNQSLRSWGGIVGYCYNTQISACYVDSVIFNYHGENKIYHRQPWYAFGAHNNCNLQIRVGIICGYFVEADIGTFSNCTYSTDKCELKLVLIAGNFHYGGHEKAYLFANLDGMVGKKE